MNRGGIEFCCPGASSRQAAARTLRAILKLVRPRSTRRCRSGAYS